MFVLTSMAQFEFAIRVSERLQDSEAVPLRGGESWFVCSRAGAHALHCRACIPLQPPPGSQASTPPSPFPVHTSREPWRGPPSPRQVHDASRSSASHWVRLSVDTDYGLRTTDYGPGAGLLVNATFISVIKIPAVGPNVFIKILKIPVFYAQNSSQRAVLMNSDVQFLPHYRKNIILKCDFPGKRQN